MKRLVYSPKVFVYIETDDGQVWNISDLVVSGNVHRLVNQVSTAEVTFKNPFKQFTQPGNPTFRPMDRITIFLQRVPGRPIQVFTGYLDETPYFQMYPGTCTLRASCTLKRLMFTYFDPGVPFMTAFMSKYGWQLTPDGMLGKQVTGGGPKSATTVDQGQSASVAQLLFAVMKWIAGWTGNREVFIDELPPGLTQRISHIYDVLTENAKDAEEQFQYFLQQYIGSDSQGGGDASSGDASGGVASGPIEGEKAITTTIKRIAEKHNVPPELALATCYIESTLGQHKHSPGSSYYGWFQQSIDPSKPPYGFLGNDTLDEAGANDLGKSCDLWARAAEKKGQTDPSLKNNLNKWAMAIQGVIDSNGNIIGNNQYYIDGWPNAMATAKRLLSKYGGSSDSTSSSTSDSSSSDSSMHDSQMTTEKSGGSKDRTSGTDSGALGWARSKLGKYSEPGGNNRGPQLDDLEKTFGLSGEPWCAMFATTAVTHGGVDDKAKTPSVAQIRAWAVAGTNGYQKGLKSDPKPGDLMIFGGSQHVGIVESVDGNNITTIEGNTSANKVARVQRTKGEGEFARPDYGSGGAGTSDAGTTTGSADALTAAKAGSVFSTFNIGSFDLAESYLLQGERSLMNDQPLMPFIEELCKGSMRNFMSMPDGSFYAFFPDYFGSFNGKPYWQIKDIEVMEGNINLTDDALATHVFVTGDLYGLGGQGNDLPLKLQTTGIVNILNAGTADFLNVDPDSAKAAFKISQDEGSKGKKEPDLQPFLGSLPAAKEFLRRYGARPYSESAPFIRSHVFETFYAFQLFMLMWARQFLTTFTFTFMPELYPGGIVAFPDHGVQMYIDEVHHTFDYTSGFTTQANLSAPAAMPSEAGKQGTAAISRGMVRGGVLSTTTNE